MGATRHVATGHAVSSPPLDAGESQTRESDSRISTSLIRTLAVRTLGVGPRWGSAEALRGDIPSLPGSKSAPLIFECSNVGGRVSVLDEVSAAIAGVDAPAWKLELARSLAAGVDAAPNASLAKELRALMDEFGAESVRESSDVADDLAAARARRRAAGS